MSQSLTTDSLISHYRIVSKIGAGGMGEVYLAQDTKLERKVALKILPEELASNRDRMERFVREAKSAASLNHPNIATIHEIGESEGVNFIAMEFIDGHTLREEIYQEQTALPKLLKFLQQVAEGLAKAHAAGIVHRDLKPDNIMISGDGHAKILDFGLAKLVEQQPMATGDSSEVATAMMPQQSSPGAVMGTVGYMSPEQARAKPVDQRSDIFSFGCVLYEAATGRKPFVGDSMVETLHKIISEPAPPITDSNPQALGELQRIIRKCLVKDPNKRYQLIRETANDLEEIIEDLKRGGEVERSVAPRASANTVAVGSAPRTSSVSQPASSAEYVVGGIRGHKLGVAAVVVLLLALIGGGYWYWRGATAGSNSIKSIAVMPFVNESGNADLEYLSDGMTETLINSLSQLPNLNVKSRSSVFRYKGKEIDPKKLASDLSVQSLLIGRITQRGDQLTLNVELIDPATENVLWGNKYERTSSQLIALQHDVARDISSKVTKLSSADEAKLTKTYTTNPEAYKFFLKGRYFSRQFTLDGFKTGVAAFNQAIELDPNYALAYAGLSDAYFYASTIHLPPTEALPKADEYARKALEHDDSLAAAHHSIANVKGNYERDFSGAKREFERAVELDPHDSLTYFDYSWLLAILGENQRAVEVAERAAQLEPEDAQIAANVIGAYVMSRRYDEALQRVQATIKLDEKVWWTYYWQGVAFSEKGMHDKAIESLQTAAQLDDSPLIRGVMAHALARAGRKAEAQRVIEDLISMSKSKFVSQASMAMGYAGLGDKDKAFEWLDKSYDSHDEGIYWTKNHPMYEPLRDDPRYKPMLKRLNLME
jgi:serine/threonine protein kinase/Tfp pilus assembly protein PilF